MPNRQVHDATSTAVGGALALVLAHDSEQAPRNSGLEMIGGLLGGFLGGRLPDLAEPATSGNHRQVLHSQVVLAGVTSLAIGRTKQWQDELRARADVTAARGVLATTSWDAWALWAQEAALRVLAGAVPSVAGGYVTHLVLDGRTPRGLPFFLPNAALP